MGCCSGNKVGDAKASTDGPDHPMKLGRRGCTDCLCLILFVIFWAGMAFIAYLGVQLRLQYLQLPQPTPVRHK